MEDTPLIELEFIYPKNLVLSTFENQADLETFKNLVNECRKTVFADFPEDIFEITIKRGKKLSAEFIVDDGYKSFLKTIKKPYPVVVIVGLPIFISIEESQSYIERLHRGLQSILKNRYILIPDRASKHIHLTVVELIPSGKELMSLLEFARWEMRAGALN